jgi:hypothetical protein
MKLIFVTLFLAALFFVFGFFFLDLSLPYFDNYKKVDAELALCAPVDDRARYFYDSVISREYREQLNFTDFNWFFRTNYLGCFEQCNPTVSVSNGVGFPSYDKATIDEYTLSDDVCGDIKMNLVNEQGQWKVNEFVQGDQQN